MRASNHKLEFVVGGPPTSSALLPLKHEKKLKGFNGGRGKWPGRDANHKLEFMVGGPPRPSSALLSGRAGEGQGGLRGAREGGPLTIN